MFYYTLTFWLCWFYRVVLGDNNSSKSLLEEGVFWFRCPRHNWEAMTFQTCSNNYTVGGQQVTLIPDIHRLDLLPTPTSSWSNVSSMSLGLSMAQQFSLSPVYFSFWRLKKQNFMTILTNQLLKPPLIAMPPDPGFMVPRRALRTVCKPALLC